MHLKILNDRIASLGFLTEDMEKLIERDDVNERLKEFAGYVKNELSNYRDELQTYLNDVEKFSFAEYREKFGKRDDELRALIQEYATFKVKVLSERS